MKLFQSFVNEHQRSYLSEQTIPVDASSNTEDNQREYELFKKVLTHNPELEAEPWGMVSWKFEHKCLIAPDEFIKFAQNKLDAGYECVFINPMIGNEALYMNVWEQGAHCGHVGLDKVATFLASQLGGRITAIMGKKSFAFCNYFIATPTFWKKYFEFTDHALKLLENEAMNNTDAGQIYNGSAHYYRDTAVSMRPFVIERLLSSFIEGTALKCTGYVYRIEQYHAKFGTQLGSFLFKLSELKNRSIMNKDQKLLQEFHTIRCNILNSDYRAVVWQLDDPFNYYVSPEFKTLDLFSK